MTNGSSRLYSLFLLIVGRYDIILTQRSEIEIWYLKGFYNRYINVTLI